MEDQAPLRAARLNSGVANPPLPSSSFIRAWNKWTWSQNRGVKLLQIGGDQNADGLWIGGATYLVTEHGNQYGGWLKHD